MIKTLILHPYKNESKSISNPDEPTDKIYTEQVELKANTESKPVEEERLQGIGELQDGDMSCNKHH